MRLTSLVPSIPLDVVAHLENCGIRTDADLLFTPAFDIYTALPPRTLSLQDVTQLISLVEELASAAAVPANDLLLMDNLARERDFDLSTGDPHLDAVLHGLGGRTVIEISGDRGSGKTVCSTEALLSSAALANNTFSIIGLCFKRYPAPVDQPSRCHRRVD